MSALSDEITSLFAVEDRVTPVRRASEVPKSYASLTLDWFDDVLCANVPGARVTGFELADRDDGSSNRQRISLTLNDAAAAAGLPDSLFCKATENLQNRIVLGASGAGKAEVDFYNHIRHRLDLEIPRVFYAGYEPASFASFVMLENLEGKATFIDERTVIDRDLAFDQVRLLAGLHGGFHGSPELGSASIPFPTWPAWWRNMMAAAPDWRRCTDAALDDCAAIMPARLYRRRGEVWAATNASVARHDALPHTLIHCDVHLKNWYITNDRRMGLSDWQNTTVGHWSRDFIYAVTTALTVEDRRAWERDLLRAYLDELAAISGVRTSEEEAWTNVRQQLFTALTFWLITLNPAPGMPDMQPERTTRAFLHRLLTAVDDHDALDSFG